MGRSVPFWGCDLVPGTGDPQRPFCKAKDRRRRGRREEGGENGKRERG